jgi:hypothetical protein
MTEPEKGLSEQERKAMNSAIDIAYKNPTISGTCKSIWLAARDFYIREQPLELTERVGKLEAGLTAVEELHDAVTAQLDRLQCLARRRGIDEASILQAMTIPEDMPVPMPVPDSAVAVVRAPGGRAAYRGKAGCRNMLCTSDGNPDRCYGWHCLHCDGPSNVQGYCSCMGSKERPTA